MVPFWVAPHPQPPLDLLGGWQHPSGRSVGKHNTELPENRLLPLISSRQVIAFAAAWLFGEKCILSALCGGDLVEMLSAGAAGARPRLLCRRHLVGTGEKHRK